MVVGIAGGGLQGAGVALELARRGVSVEILEKRAACLTQASTQNEGKIHLGFVYSNDFSFETARLMIEGAYSFLPIVESWLEQKATWVVSRPFEYLVHQQSLLVPDDLARRYDRIHSLVREREAGSPSGAYFGADGARPVERLPDRERDARFGPGAAAVFRTGEVAIDPEGLSQLISRRLEGDPRIRVICNAAVEGVTPGTDDVQVSVRLGDQEVIRRYDHFVNCTWEDLVRIDRTAGVEPVAPWSYRMKYFLRVRSVGRRDVPSVTVVLGGFGDLVNYGDDYFLSWYPVGRRGFTTGADVPAWPSPLQGASAAEVREGIYSAIHSLIPAVSELPFEAVDAAEVQGGVIYALGTTEVNEPGSGLHRRFEVGPRSFGRYHTVDTGKYTVAPLFARRLADHLSAA